MLVAFGAFTSGLSTHALHFGDGALEQILPPQEDALRTLSLLHQLRDTLPGSAAL